MVFMAGILHPDRLLGQSADSLTLILSPLQFCLYLWYFLDALLLPFGCCAEVVGGSSAHQEPSRMDKPSEDISVQTHSATAEHTPTLEGAGPRRKPTLQQENAAVWVAVWPVLVAFFTSVTVLYLVFPFFTYVPSSGLLGDHLPKVRVSWQVTYLCKD